MNINSSARKKVLFLSDLDGTWLSKKPENRAKLDKEILEIRDEYRTRGVDLKFGFITARPPQRTAKENLPAPDWTVTYNGAKISRGGPGKKAPSGEFVAQEADKNWVETNRATGFNTLTAARQLDGLLEQKQFSNLTIKTVGEVVDNPSADANEFTAAICVDQESIKLTKSEKRDANKNGIPDLFEAETFTPPKQLQRLVKALDQKLEEEGVGHQVSPLYLFHGKPYVMFDVASPHANKGDAVSFLQQQEQVTPEHTIVAGDGGNDIAMMTGPDGKDEGRRSIVVGGDAGLTGAAAKLRNSILRPAKEDSSLGVLAGLRQHLDAIVLA